MESSGPQTTGDTVFGSQWCVIYNAETFEILHIQEYIAVDDGGADHTEELEALAIANAARYFPENRLAVAHPDSSTAREPSTVRSIDRQTMTLNFSESFGFDRDLRPSDA